MDELALQRMMRESQEQERLEHEALLLAAQRKLYREANGAQAATYEALEAWVHTHLQGLEVDPYDVLDRAEMAQVWEDVVGLARLRTRMSGGRS